MIERQAGGIAQLGLQSGTAVAGVAAFGIRRANARYGRDDSGADPPDTVIVAIGNIDIAIRSGDSLARVRKQCTARRSVVAAVAVIKSSSGHGAENSCGYIETAHHAGGFCV